MRTVHIGNLIRRKVELSGMSKAGFAKRLGIARQNIEKIVFAKGSIDTNLLVEISNLLEYDFFDCYRSNDEIIRKQKSLMKYQKEVFEVLIEAAISYYKQMSISNYVRAFIKEKDFIFEYSEYSFDDANVVKQIFFKLKRHFVSQCSENLSCWYKEELKPGIDNKVFYKAANKGFKEYVRILGITKLLK